MRMDLTLRFDYGASVPWVSRVTEETGAVSDDPCEMPGCVLRAIAGPDMVVLRTPAQVRGENLSTVAEFAVAAGEAMPFVLTHSPSHRPLPASIDAIEAQRDTEPAGAPGPAAAGAPANGPRPSSAPSSRSRR